MALLRTRKSVPRSSAAVQRRRLMDAARSLLCTHRLTALTLSDVAAKAKVPKSSAYHYFDDIEDLYIQLLLVVHNEVQVALGAPLGGPLSCWADVIARLMERGKERFAADPATQQLLIGPEASFDLRLQVLKSDVSLGRVFERQVDAHFELPDIAERAAIFFRAIEIAGLMFCLSFIDHGRITEEMTAEATRAAVAYLRLYIPEKLPRRRAAASSRPGARRILARDR
jgi:AcrR family transcriptional regulator